MVCYTHNLEYNVVEAFNGATCSLEIEVGNIKITDGIVHSVMGLPDGNDLVDYDAKREAYHVWAEQFPCCKRSEITPLRVRNKILENGNANNNFKWNFLIMVYNFFIE